MDRYKDRTHYSLFWDLGIYLKTKLFRLIAFCYTECYLRIFFVRVMSKFRISKDSTGIHAGIHRRELQRTRHRCSS